MRKALEDILNRIITKPHSSDLKNKVEEVLRETLGFQCDDKKGGRKVIH